MKHWWIGGLAAVMVECASAWGDGGHMMVAQIAYDRLDAPVKQKVDALIKAGAGGTTRWSSFVSAAHWADDTRTPATADWHFIDFPFAADGTPLPALPKPDNVQTALQAQVAVLKGKSSTAKAVQQRADALRYVIHFVGDIHQPLHCVTRVSQAHPQGDRGGNDFFVEQVKDGHLQRVKLHSFWDGGLLDFPRDHVDGQGHFIPPLPAVISAMAGDIVGRHPASSMAATAPQDFAAWAQESNKLAREFVYAGVTEESTPSATYLTQGTAIAEQRVAWAGYRLAKLLNTVLK